MSLEISEAKTLLELMLGQAEELPKPPEPFMPLCDLFLFVPGAAVVPAVNLRGAVPADRNPTEIAAATPQTTRIGLLEIRREKAAANDAMLIFKNHFPSL